MTHIKKLSEENLEEIYELSQFAFQYDLSQKELERKKREAEPHEIWGWMEDDRLAAKLHNIPLECYIEGKLFKMGGVNAVAAWPEYRRKGMVKALLHHSLKQMRENGQLVSFLHPFSYKFYRKYGWELTFANKHYSIPMENLKGKWKTNGKVMRIKNDIPLLQGVYTEYAKQFNGMLVRDEHWWKYRVLDDSQQIAVSFNETGEADGYLLYQVKDKVFSVREVISHTVQAKKSLLQFISNHDSMAERIELTVPENDNLFLLLEEPKFKQEIQPYFMARVVDVESFLNQYPFKKEEVTVPFSITVEDDFLEENNGSYLIEQLDSSLKVAKKNQVENNVTCSIQQLSAMFLGYKQPSELFELDLITGSDQAVRQLEIILSSRQTFLSDFF